ncbi:methionine/alanine import family NSS transporter small subunit [Virgibacillus proomii]|nr:methionine/alanine import family NSS transporter small subunit [Virgibacillus proomii]MBU5267428.1 methionine/alanine import family NSS transporter small subunit [Virgibacillus proomii]
MSTSAIIVMVLGMLVIWGGLATSITYAIKKSREKTE